MRILEPISKSGVFWMVQSPEVKVPGTLTISDGGECLLEIVGALSGKQLDYGQFNEKKIRIIGDIEDVGYVTLDDCFYEKLNVEFGVKRRSKLYVGSVVFGLYYYENEEITALSVSFLVEGAFEWAFRSGVTTDIESNKKFRLEYVKPDGFIIKIDDFDLNIFFGHKLNLRNANESITFGQFVRFELKSHDSKALRDYLIVMSKVSMFLSFCMGEFLSIHTVVFETLDGGEGASNHEYYFRSSAYSESRPKLNDLNYVLKYKDIENLSYVLNNWFDLYNHIEPSLNLCFSVLNNQHQYLYGRFLAIAQSIETFHRCLSDRMLMDSDEFSKLVSLLVENCPEQYKNWLNGRLQYGNEMTLSQRLKDICYPYLDLMRSRKEVKDFIGRVVITRNYFTHYSPDMEFKSFHGQSLYLACLKLENIFQLHILDRLGFSYGNISNIVNRNSRLKRNLLFPSKFKEES